MALISRVRFSVMRLDRLIPHLNLTTRSKSDLAKHKLIVPSLIGVLPKE